MSELNHPRALSICLMCDEVLRVLDSGQLRDTSRGSISGAIEFLDSTLVGASYIRTSQSEVGFDKWLNGLRTYRQVLEANPSLRMLQPEELERKIQSYQVGLRQVNDKSLDRDDLRAELKGFFKSLDEYYANQTYPVQERDLMVA